ncbi:hypothetical protein TBLA_0F00900 [Henningerozyma blattae CBS 6284]|uniref:N-terminal acetyltransferase A complex subunit NAT1 n=1 Tax=Henningerozyma blattae (strain ATCC 34711 / CBS 6284 / DSM 70876 / NBRC 10599 / NRRL Y-10934 / UCD 77-7) TaxID=1071380 RepID=I2H5I2_HENB6|nr:hypothetical protein TBLA_0F00900 [Tetrapisispora blattae CBS 6284]CCH61634.1 hypothetical protein TBLA_0F00900 [Tetrapisispora blattae CBS 6284]
MSRRRGGPRPKTAPSIGKAKDTTVFLEALKLYESKNYKKSIKLLDGVLKKSHNHVDSLVLKGLDLFYLGEKDEAKVFVNNALSKINGTEASAICCHVIGIYMRSTKQYSESIKWFQASLDNGSKNYQIYRDLSTLQSQVGDFKAVLESRKRYWENYMGYRANWTSYAVAQDINGEYHQAVNTLSQFEKLAAGKLGQTEMYENNECIIYKNDIMYRSAGSDKSRLANVLKHLVENEKDIYDKFAVLERKASIYMKMGNFKEASIVYRTLIKRNPDNFKYYNLLEVALNIKNDNKLRKALYEKLETFYPRCEPPKFIPLTFITDEVELTKNLEKYVLPLLRRGVPATFSNVKPLYRSRSFIAKILEKIVIEYLETIDPKESPISYIWTCYYLTHHYLFLKDFNKAQEFIEKALSHSPTIVEFYILKGRILKHLGLLDDAAGVLEEGRQLDLQDRFINTKTVKYFLRANNIDKAVEIASLFTKNDDSPNGIKDLHLVEVSWFIVEQAEAYYRLFIEKREKLHIEKAKLVELLANETPNEEESENIAKLESELRELEWTVKKYQGLSLKRFAAISKIYDQFDDDQLDFHSYCMRKGTPRAYLEMIQWGNTIFTQPMYVRAMVGASKIQFGLHDKLIEDKQLVANEEENKNSTKMNKRVKKEIAALNKRKEDEKKFVAAYTSEQDQDVYGKKLIDSKEPLTEFANLFYTKYNKQVQDYAKNNILEFEYHYREGKLALCLGAISKYSKRFGKSIDVVGSLSIILGQAARENSSFDSLAKKVALKGLETEISEFPINEINNNEFDWMKYFQDNYKIHNLISLVLLKHYLRGNDSNISDLILNYSAKLEPQQQNMVLQYEL